MANHSPPVGGNVATFTTPNGTLFGVHGHHSSFWDRYIFRAVRHECHATQANVPFNASWPFIAEASYYNGNRAGSMAHPGEIYGPDPDAISKNYTDCIVQAMNGGNCNANGAVWGLGCGLGIGVPVLIAAGLCCCCPRRHWDDRDEHGLPR